MNATATTMSTITPEQEEFFRLRQQCTSDAERLCLDCMFITTIKSEKDRQALITAYRTFKSSKEFRQALRLVRKARREQEQAGDLTAAGEFDRLAQFIQDNLLAA